MDTQTVQLPLDYPELGQYVTCEYRMGSGPLQPWNVPIRVGRVIAPEATQANYCATYGYVAVQYTWGVMYDRLDSLQSTAHTRDYWPAGVYGEGETPSTI